MAKGTTSLLSSTVYALSDATSQFTKAAQKVIYLWFCAKFSIILLTDMFNMSRVLLLLLLTSKQLLEWSSNREARVHLVKG